MLICETDLHKSSGNNSFLLLSFHSCSDIALISPSRGLIVFIQAIELLCTVYSSYTIQVTESGPDILRVYNYKFSKSFAIKAYSDLDVYPVDVESTILNYMALIYDYGDCKKNPGGIPIKIIDLLPLINCTKTWGVT